MNRKELAIVAVEHGARWCQNILAELSGNHGMLIPPKSRELLIRIMKDLVELNDSLNEPTQSAPIVEARFNLYERSKPDNKLHPILNNATSSIVDSYCFFEPGWMERLGKDNTYEYEKFIRWEKRWFVVERVV